MKSGLRRTLSVLGMCLLLGATLAACGTQSDEAEPTVTREDVAGAPPTRTATVEGGEDESSPVPSSSQATPADSAGPTGNEPGGGAPTEIVVDMVDLAFDPTELSIPADTDVTIQLTNSGALPHAMEVVDQGLESDEIAGGGSGSFVINLPPGTYDFICPVPGHADAGMVGTLIVS